MVLFFCFFVCLFGFFTTHNFSLFCSFDVHIQVGLKATFLSCDPVSNVIDSCILTSVSLHPTMITCLFDIEMRISQIYTYLQSLMINTWSCGRVQIFVIEPLTRMQQWTKSSLITLMTYHSFGNIVSTSGYVLLSIPHGAGTNQIIFNHESKHRLQFYCSRGFVWLFPKPEYFSDIKSRLNVILIEARNFKMVSPHMSLYCGTCM